MKQYPPRNMVEREYLPLAPSLKRTSIVMEIINPVDQYTYVGYGRELSELSLIQFGGSDELATLEYENGYIRVTTPCYTENPQKITVFANKLRQ